MTRYDPISDRFIVEGNASMLSRRQEPPKEEA